MTHSTSRRRFLKGAAAGATALGLSRFTALSYAQIAGSNEAIRMGVIGFNGRGNSHINAWMKIPGVRLVALCDADEAVLNKGYERVMNPKPSTRPATAPAAPVTLRPTRIDKYGDLRKLLDSKDIDGISTATPNHWHALITVWACQAGKDVYVEKPTSHEVWEGRKTVEAARKYNRIVQAGTQSRSSLFLKEALDWVRAGNLGKIQVARGLCYNRRASIGKVDATPPVPATVNLDLWCGPSPLEAPHREKFHYDWHWFWQTGNGDIGNQGIHQMDIARWALGKNELSSSILSVGGRLGYEDDAQTANTQFAIHNYGDALLIFEVRGLPSKPGNPKQDVYKTQSVGHVIECENGYLAGTTVYDKKDAIVRKFDESTAKGSIENRFQDTHFVNFIDAMRTRKVSDLHADIEQGHLSSALCHTSNISYRLGQKADPDAIKAAVKSDPAALDTFERFKEHLTINKIDIATDKLTLGMPLKMDPKTERIVDNEKANAMLRRDYRTPFVMPDVV